MKPVLRFFIALGTALLLAALAAGPASPQGLPFPTAIVTGQKIAVPTYFAPGPLWERLKKGVPTVGLAILNPNSGPGASQDFAYAAEVQHARAAGIRVLGYVHTSNGGRRTASVKREVDRYYLWYGVDGIFFDEADVNNCSKLAYYTNLYNYVKTKGGTALVVINPGTNIPECYMTSTDIMVNFEDNYSAYLAWRPSVWVSKYPADRFWHLVIATPRRYLVHAVTLSKKRNAGWVHVTPDVLNNPWDSLPPAAYWTSELSLVGQ